MIQEIEFPLSTNYKSYTKETKKNVSRDNKSNSLAKTV